MTERCDKDEDILRWFECDHLRPSLQAVVRPFADLARTVASTLLPSDQRSQCLIRLLEAKDCVVRAAIDDPDNPKA